MLPAAREEIGADLMLAGGDVKTSSIKQSGWLAVS